MPQPCPSPSSCPLVLRAHQNQQQAQTWDAVVANSSELPAVSLSSVLQRLCAADPAHDPRFWLCGWVALRSCKLEVLVELPPCVPNLPSRVVPSHTRGCVLRPRKGFGGFGAVRH